jgi:actin-like protein 6B
VRAGYAGDDTPKAIIPSYYGYTQVKEQDVLMGDGTEVIEQPPKAKLYIGSSGPSVWRSGMEVANPVTDGMSGVQVPFLLV